MSTRIALRSWICNCGNNGKLCHSDLCRRSEGGVAQKVQFSTVFENAEGVHSGTGVQIVGLHAGFVEEVELKGENRIPLSALQIYRYEKGRGQCLQLKNSHWSRLNKWRDFVNPEVSWKFIRPPCVATQPLENFSWVCRVWGKPYQNHHWVQPRR